jgi:hypothetical protein
MTLEGSPSSILNAWLPWYARFERSRVFKPLGNAMDAVLQTAIDAVRLRYPSVSSNERSLTLIGKDRRIPRAPNEPAESYARRLLLWLDIWSMAGTPAGLLYVMQSFMYPNYPVVRLIGRDSFWWQLDQYASRDLTIREAVSLPCATLPGEESLRWIPPVGISQSPRAALWGHQGANNWDWDSISNPERASNWWDYWIEVCDAPYSLAGKYDGTGDEEVFWDSGRAWDFDEIFGTFDVMRELIRLYQRAGAECRGIIFTPSATEFSPDGTPSASWPDGQWGAESKIVSGASVPTRNLDYEYLLPPFNAA